MLFEDLDMLSVLWEQVSELKLEGEVRVLWRKTKKKFIRR
jgi:hypothetical protein